MNRRRLMKRIASPHAADRAGSTLVVVIALLGALLLLGMLVLSLSSQEEINSEYFADAAKDPQGDFGPDVYFDFCLRQVILGPHPTERQSALYGGRWSLLPNMYGRDINPHSGPGINLIWNSALGIPVVDLDQDGTADGGYQYLLDLNNSPVAQGSVLDYTTYSVPEPDAGYTYPDINSVHISYDGLAPTAGAAGRVMIPSFHRPQYLRNLRDGMGNMIPVGQWYTHADSKRRILRPHAEHQAIADDGTVTNTRRFVSAANPDTAPGTALGNFPFTVGQQGVWSGHGTSYDLDADPDGDGVRDAIWLDLDFPPQQTGPGEWFVPMFAVTLRDLDATFNLNTGGNVSALSSLTATQFGPIRIGAGPDGRPGIAGLDDDGNGIVDDERELGWSGSDDTNDGLTFISRSNRGDSPSEVNPQWGLHGDPTAVSDALKKRHYDYFRNPALIPSPVNVNAPITNPIEVANMEWWWLLTGGVDFTSGYGSSIGTKYPGRWGETGRLDAAISSRIPYLFPLPGRAFPGDPTTFNPSNPSHYPYDDNTNFREQGPFADAVGAIFPPIVVFPAGAHPLDFAGNGRWIVTGSLGKLRATTQVGQHKYARYDNYMLAPNLNYLTPNVLQGGRLLPGGATRYLVDEPQETRLEPAQAQSDTSDSIFSASDTADLHMVDNDKTSLGFSGRPSTLAPLNFKDAPNAETLRKMFTTVSWDMKARTHGFYGAAGTADKFRRWEFASDYDGDGNPEFPPQFPGIAVADRQRLDPFRQELRDLLTVDAGEKTIKGVQGKLSVNHALDRGLDGRLRFRPLTPHTVDLPATPVRQQLGGFYPTRPEQINGSAAQEWMARRDRQLLCRDIYVLLYTLGGGNDAKNYLSDNSDAAGQLLFSFDPLDARGRGDQCKLMAQFAVNLVDRMDPDDVMTAFEYDVNLNNGWNLDDDPFTADITNENLDERGIVYGVEEQQLVFNEAIALWAKRTMMGGVDHSFTEYNDSANRDWLFMELENVSSRNVTFTNEAWQIAVRPNLMPAVPTATALNGVVSGQPLIGQERRLTFTPAAPAIGTGTSSMFTVGTMGDNSNKDSSGNLRNSQVVINTDHGKTGDDTILKKLIPRAGGLNLDLMTGGTSRYRVNEAPTTLGTAGESTLVSSSSTDPSGRELLSIVPMDQDDVDNSLRGSITIILELRRRLHPARGLLEAASGTNHELQSRDNPWIPVDELRIPLNITAIDVGHNYIQIRQNMDTVKSRERRDPMNRTNPVDQFIPLLADQEDYHYFILNSIGGRNFLGSTTPPDVFPMWQAHENRDFGSVPEIFNVPTYGPDELTKRLPFVNAPAPPFPDSGFGNFTAGYMFLNAKHPSPPASGPGAPAEDFDNRWHRLLGFMDVPSRWSRHTNNPPYAIDAGRVGDSKLGIYRTPGLINLNMLRHPEVLAGMIDDPTICQLTLGTGPNFLTDRTGDGTNRDWWIQLLRARDGVDPGGSGSILPGVPKDLTQTLYGSRPFREASFSASGIGSLQETIYRGLPLDILNPTTTTGPRQLFELGTQSEHDGGQVDHTVKHRLLSKMANYSTIRSNSYVAFVQVDFFEAKEVTDAMTTKKVFRVGSKLATSPGHRGIFVIDRSKAHELLTGNDMPFGPNTYQNFSFNQSFNFRSLILHRQTIK